MKAKHLTLDNRKAIQEGIEKYLLKTAIAISISKDPTTVAKEIKLHRTVKQRSRFNFPVVCTKLKQFKKHISSVQKTALIMSNSLVLCATVHRRIQSL